MTKSKKILNIPNILTIFRMIMMIPFAFFCMNDGILSGLLAVIFFVLAGATDFIDGRLARKMKQTTDVGAFLDPLADKMLVNIAFLCLCMKDLVPIWVLIIILARDFAVDGIRLVAARNAETIAASIWGKAKTMSQMIAITVLLANALMNFSVIGVIGNILLYVSLTLTVFSGCEYVIRGWRKFLS